MVFFFLAGGVVGCVDDNALVRLQDAHTPGPSAECSPSCDGRECRYHDCCGVCGVCNELQFCCAGNCCPAGTPCTDGVCDCEPDCSDRQCGSDGCAGQCGECTGPQEECQGGLCLCLPDCIGLACGEDGCGGSCGECSGANGCLNGACVPADPACPESWYGPEIFPGGENYFCYLFDGVRMREWHWASLECAKKGALLTSVHGTEEDQLIYGLALAAGGQHDYWIGLKQGDAATGPASDWQWVDGSAADYENWQHDGTDQPDDSDGHEDGEEDCARVTPHSALSDKWADARCNKPLNFACKKKADMILKR